MYALLRLKFSICVSLLIAIYPREAEGDGKGPGESSCVLGMPVATCGFKVPLDVFPDSCTSLFYDVLTINEKHELLPADNEFAVYLPVLGKTGKKIYINISRDNITEWAKILDCDGQNAMKDADGIIAFSSRYPGIKGLLLTALAPDSDSEEIVGYTENILKYIETVKTKTGMEIAFQIRAHDFMDYHEKYHGPWLNFTELNACVDSYVFRLFSSPFDCTKTLRSGILPIDGDEKYTLEKLKAVIEASQIPKEKVYFNVYLLPKSAELFDFLCDVSYQAMCLLKDPKTANSWCADTQETYFEKGQWFHQNGAGFVGTYIDFDDPRGCCKCGPFPSFNAILAGFKGTASVPSCPLYDRLC